MTQEEVTVTTREILITQLRRVCSMYVSDAVAASARLEMEYAVEKMGKELVAMIDLPKEELKVVSGEASYEIPLTWFDHMRLDLVPNFLRRKWPIRFRTQTVPIEIEIGVVYPQFKTAFPDESRDMRFYSIPRISLYSMRPESHEN